MFEIECCTFRVRWRKQFFLQQFNGEGTRFMEYTDDYGYFDDVPIEFMIRNLKEHYPNIFDTNENITEFKL